MRTLIALFICFNSFGQIPTDKMLHFSAGYGVGTLVTGFTGERGILYGVLASSGIGVLKEVYDIKHGNPELADFMATALGGVVGSLVVHEIKKVAVKKEKLKL